MAPSSPYLRQAKIFPRWHKRCGRIILKDERNLHTNEHTPIHTTQVPERCCSGQYIFSFLMCFCMHSFTRSWMMMLMLLMMMMMI